MKIISTDSQRDKNVFSPSKVHFWHFCQGLWKNNNCNARVTTFFIVFGHLILEGLLKMAINLISYISKAETIYVSSVAPTYEHNLCHDAILSVEQLYAVSIWFFQFTLWSSWGSQILRKVISLHYLPYKGETCSFLFNLDAGKG